MENKYFEYWVGRIPECLERYRLEEKIINELLGLYEDDGNFNPAKIAERGWVAIDAPYNFGKLMDEPELIVEYSRRVNVDTLYATSKLELERAQNGSVLLVRLPQFSAKDFFPLQLCGWLFDPFREKLIEKSLYWDSCERAIYFTLPLKFALIRIINDADNREHTTIAGEPELIDMIKMRSLRLPEPGDLNGYDFFGRPLIGEARKYVEHLRKKNCLYEWFDWPEK